MEFERVRTDELDLLGRAGGGIRRVALVACACGSPRTAGTGRVVELQLPGARSGISRKGFVYLPPQYFEPVYAHTLFPVVELLHGDPGDPTAWIYALHVPDIMDQEINSGAVGPMIVVMPATFSGAHGQDWPFGKQKAPVV